MFLNDFWRDVWTVFGAFGTAATLVGLVIAVVQIRKTTTAAEAARVAAEDARRAVLRHDAVAAFASALEVMNEIRRLHRSGEWQVVVERYADLTRLLVGVAGSDPDLTDDDRVVLRDTIGNVAKMERQAERAIAGGVRPPDAAKLNRTISTEAALLADLSARLRRRRQG